MFSLVSCRLLVSFFDDLLFSTESLRPIVPILTNCARTTFASPLLANARVWCDHLITNLQYYLSQCGRSGVVRGGDIIRIYTIIIIIIIVFSLLSLFGYHYYHSGMSTSLLILTYFLS